MMARTLYALIFLTVFIQMRHSYPYRDIDACQSSADCPFGQCCVIGMTRYSFPRCQPLGQMGHFCRMDNEPENRTLFYPNGLMIDVVDIYTVSCPCDIGFVCRSNVCLTEDSYDDNNYLF